MKIKFFLFSLLVLLLSAAQAQDNGQPDANTSLMRSNGRIYVVVAVMLTILTGLIIYLVRLDRKLSRLEKGR